MALTLERADPPAELLRALYGITHAAAHLLDTGRIGDTAADALREVFAADIVGLWLMDRERGALRQVFRSPPRPDAVGARLLLPGRGLCGVACATGRMQVTDDYAASGHAGELMVQQGILAAMAAPMFVDGQPIGALFVGAAAPRRFSSEECEALRFVAEQLAPVTEAVRLRMQLDRRREEAEALAELARRGLGSVDVAELLSLLAQHTTSLLGADYAMVTGIDVRYSATLRASAGATTPFREGPISRGGVSRLVLRLGRTLVLRSGSPSGRRRLARSPVHSKEGAQALVITPLPIREDLRGVLHAGWRTAFQPGPEEVRLAETLAAFGATIIDNARRHEHSERLAGRLQAIIDQMPSGVVVADGEGRLSILNQAGRTIFGLSEDSPLVSGLTPDDPRLRGAMERIHLDFRDTALARAMAGERVQQHEYAIHTADGRQAWLQASATPLLDAEGRQAGAISVFSDVSERRRLTEQRERETERRLALAAISEALSDTTRDVSAMLSVTARTMARSFNATCTVRRLDAQGLRLIQGAVSDEDDGFRRRMEGLLLSEPLPLRESRHMDVVRDGKSTRLFDPGGSGLRNSLRPIIRDLLGNVPLYAMLVAPLRAHGQILGTLALYRHSEPLPFSEEDELFAEDVGARAGLVLENGRLFEQLAASRTRLEELSQRMVQLSERERRAIALELHDEIGQGLTGARLMLQAARRLPARLRDERLEEACKTLDETVAQVRGLSLDLRPPLLDRFGLAAALEAYLERYTDRTGIVVTCRSNDMSARPSPHVETAAYRIVQEGLTNVARYAGVTHAEVSLWSTDQHLWVRVADEGKGFDPSELEWEPSTGLNGMQERAELLGGEVTIDSAPGQGTRLLARLPLRIASSPTVALGG